VMTFRFVALMRREPRLHRPIIAWIHQALTFMAHSNRRQQPLSLRNCLSL
jgi:hypothetical protein